MHGPGPLPSVKAMARTDRQSPPPESPPLSSGLAGGSPAGPEGEGVVAEDPRRPGKAAGQAEYDWPVEAEEQMRGGLQVTVRRGPTAAASSPSTD